MNILTICVIAFLVIAALIGAKRGIARMAVSIASFVIAILLVAFLREPVGKLIHDHTGLEQSVEKGISTFVDDSLEAVSKETGVQIRQAKDAVDALPLPKVIREQIIKAMGSGAETAVRSGINGIADSFTKALTGYALNAIYYCATFVATWIIVSLLSLVVIAVFKLPVLKQVNALAGGVVGFAFALLILWVCCVVVTSFAATEWGQSTLEMIKESPLLSFIYNHNILLNTVLKNRG